MRISIFKAEKTGPDFVVIKWVVSSRLLILKYNIAYNNCKVKFNFEVFFGYCCRQFSNRTVVHKIRGNLME